MALMFIILVFICFWFCLRKKFIDKRIVTEGVIIGVVSGIIISFITDVNFQARIKGPFIELARKFNNQLRYASKTWGDIKATQVEEGVVDVSATNIASGVTVTYKNTPLSKLPSDLAYAVSTGDITENKSIVNILSPSIDSIHVAGGSIVEIQTKKEK